MLVATDGNRARYPNGLHIGVRNERSFYTATWVVPQDVYYSLVPFWGKIFYFSGRHFYEIINQTMANFSLNQINTKLKSIF